MRLVLIGACGRMGNAVGALAKERGHRIVAGVDERRSPLPFPLCADLGQTGEADVIVDFSSARGLEERLVCAVARGTPYLLGVTGCGDEEGEALERAAKHIPVFRAENFSLGVAVVALLAERAAGLLGEFDIEIVERHHRNKQDAPSGTALLLKESAERGRGRALEGVSRGHGMAVARQEGEICIHSVRGGTVVGAHEIGFYGTGEVVTISHFAESRTVFAAGALKAAEWLIRQAAGLYTMRDFLDALL